MATGGGVTDYQYVNHWEPRDTISWLSDGTSNTLVVGEKHIPAFALNSDTNSHKLWDGGYYGAYPLAQIHNVGRTICGDRSPALTMGPNDPRIVINTEPQAAGNTGRYGFGSSHNGTVNFLIGDASVRGLSVTTQQDLIFNLACVNDGNPATLP